MLEGARFAGKTLREHLSDTSRSHTLRRNFAPHYIVFSAIEKNFFSIFYRVGKTDYVFANSAQKEVFF
jgi:hypothetical protein